MIQHNRLIRSYAAALLTLGAAAIHVAAIPGHFSEYWPYGVFFISLATAQVGLAVAFILKPSRRLYAGALMGTIALIAIWLLSRTTGLPIAPRPWRPEEVAFPDLAATLLEASTCLVLVRRLRRPSGKDGRIRRVLTMLPAALFTPLLAFGGVGGLLSPMPEAYSAAPFVPGQASRSVANLTAPAGAEPLKSFTLTAEVSRLDGREVWTYNGTVPGPQLRVTQGDRVRVTLVNHLPDATSIHWHGIRVPNADDGVAGITQDAVAPGKSFVYEFIANDAGTYWYHSHQDTSKQLPRGLFGALIVDQRDAPNQVQRDYPLMIHLLPGSGTVAVNGNTHLHLEANPGDSVRIRLIDGIEAIGFGPGEQVQSPVLLGAPYAVAAMDGHDLNRPELLGPERIVLGMGQRADLVFKMPVGSTVRLVGLKGAEPFMPFSPPQSTTSVTIGTGPDPAAATGSLPQFDLTSYGTRSADAVLDAPRFDVTHQIVLAGSPTFRNGTFDFADTFNGQASPFVEPIRVRLGDFVRLRIVNTTEETHPIHIHGHVFTVLAKNGAAVTGSPVHLDAILVGPRETWDVGFVADNPGVWMLHCHVLNHAAGGMSMTVNYEGISTPFTMGSRSGNIPE